MSSMMSSMSSSMSAANPGPGPGAQRRACNRGAGGARSRGTAASDHPARALPVTSPVPLSSKKFKPRPPLNRALPGDSAVPTMASQHDGGSKASDSKASDNVLVASLSKFYSQRGVMPRVLPYISGTSAVSLRLLDWFVTNYAKKHNTIIPVVRNGAVTQHFNVYLSYRAQLKSYSKQQFDPFRRRERIMLKYERNRSVETTVGQLNFFRWMLQNDVLDYVADHADAVEADMMATAAANAAPPPRAHTPARSSSRRAQSPSSPSLSSLALSSSAQSPPPRHRHDSGVSASARAPPGSSSSSNGRAAAAAAPAARKKRVELSQAGARKMNYIVGSRTVLFN
jgi:hypothetical protein